MYSKIEVNISEIQCNGTSEVVYEQWSVWSNGEWSEMDTMINVWAVVEHVRVASGAAELAIFTAILYWFFTSRFVLFIFYLINSTH